MEKAALVIIDSQENIFGRGDQAAWRAAETLHNIRLLLDKARETGMPVVYVQHEDEGLPRGTDGWRICHEIAPRAGEPVVEKHTMDSFYRTELDAVLKRLGVKTLILCGMQTEYCVDTACRRAYTMGYDAFLVSDGHASRDNGHLTGAQIVAHHNMILKSEFLQVKSTGELLEAMGV